MQVALKLLGMMTAIAVTPPCTKIHQTTNYGPKLWMQNMKGKKNLTPGKDRAASYITVVPSRIALRYLLPRTY